MAQTQTAPVEAIVVQETLPKAVTAHWEALLDALPEAPPFLHPAWFEAALRSRLIPTGQVLLFTRAGVPCGLLPLAQRTPWTAEAAATLLPEDAPALIRPGDEAYVWTQLAAWMRTSHHWLVHLGGYDAAELAQQAPLYDDTALRVQTRPGTPTVQVDLTGGWDAYLARLSKSTRYKMRHSEAQLREAYPSTVFEVLTETKACLASLEILIELSCQRWSAEGQASYLADVRMATFYRQVLRWLCHHGYGQIMQLRVAGRIVALATVLHIPGQTAAYYHVVGRDIDALPQRFSPGMVLASGVFRWAVARGITRVCMGHGATPYKLILGGAAVPLQEVLLGRAGQPLLLLRKLDSALHYAGAYLRQRLPQHAPA